MPIMIILNLQKSCEQQNKALTGLEPGVASKSTPTIRLWTTPGAV